MNWSLLQWLWPNATSTPAAAIAKRLTSIESRETNAQIMNTKTEVQTFYSFIVYYKTCLFRKILITISLFFFFSPQEKYNKIKIL